MDGVDASIIKSDGENFAELVDDIYLKYDNKLQSKLKKIVDLCVSKDQFFKLAKDIKELEHEITIFHAKICKLIIKKNTRVKVDLIGFHGQTVLHEPKNGHSIQIGDSNLLAKVINKKVVSNFRDNDILNGGQGAPLTPLYHRIILKKIKTKLPSIIINIGGIANVTFLDNENKITSFDTGPGNYLINEWVKSNSKLDFDNKGLLAKSGRLNESLLKKLLKDPYYNKKSPKSLDVKNFNIKELKKLSLKDGCATLSMLTAETICLAINNFKNTPNKILFSGGGRKNDFIIDSIEEILKKKVYLIDEFNFNGDFIESQAFAYLAIRSYLKKIISLPSTTGVKKPCSGGVIYKN